MTQPRKPRATTAAKPAATPAGKAAAARAEVADEPAGKSVEFRGITLTLPDELPATLLFDVVELESSENAMPVFRLLKTILDDQFTAVRNLIRPDDNVIDVVDGLISDIFGQYGLTLGE